MRPAGDGVFVGRSAVLPDLLWLLCFTTTPLFYVGVWFLIIALAIGAL